MVEKRKMVKCFDRSSGTILELVRGVVDGYVRDVIERYTIRNDSVVDGGLANGRARFGSCQ